MNIESKEKLNGLSAKDTWGLLYNKELNCKKNVLEYIEFMKILKQEPIDKDQIQENYTFIYNSIDEMAGNIKPNTIMYLKNQLKSQLGKYVSNKDPKPVNHFIEFFKKAYPEKMRRKDFTWVLMDINKITDEQIWNTLTYINTSCIKDRIRLTTKEKEHIIDMVKLLVNRGNIKYVNQVKSLEKLLRILYIKVVNSKDKFKVIKY